MTIVDLNRTIQLCHGVGWMTDNHLKNAGSQSGWTPSNIYTLILLTLIYAINTVDRNLLGLLIPLIKGDLNLSDTTIGLLSGFAFAAFYATAALPIASLADRWNRRNIIAAGLAFWSVMTLCHGLVRNAWQLALTRFLLGAGEASSVAPSNSIIADLFNSEQRPAALGFLAASTSIGVLIAFPVLGFVSEEYGWRVSFIAAGAPGIALALILFLTVREPKRIADASHSGSTSPVALGEALTRLASKPAYVFAVAAGTLISLNMAVMHTWVPTFLSRVHDLSQTEIGSFIGVLRGGGGIIGGLGGGWLATYLGRKDPRWRYRVPAFAMLLIAPAQLLLIFGGDSLWKVGLALETLLVMAQIGPLFALLLASSDERTRAVAIATFLFVSNIIGQGGGPVISGLVSDVLTPAYGNEAIRYAMLISVVVALVAGLFTLIAGKLLKAPPPPVFHLQR
ncbi:spinster family MFS transporter [Hyphococcus luteus]|uniref:MFS transporter n=1 Tax=Hyphococcus luteus TaxID=2058213 RepID=A0A2S7K5C7_9PROT|nr:MFS transporter [Marinicaulis flavus]PQA87648.1 MFS transporter [Marinicaulis flavus]